MRMKRFVVPRVRRWLSPARFPWVFAVAIVLCIPTLPAFGQVLEHIRDAGEIRLGYVTDGKPFAYRARGGKPQGYAVELCEHIVAAAESRLALPHLGVAWIAIPFDARVSEVQKGGVDVMCTPVVPTLARRRAVSFSLPVFPGGNRAVIRKDSPRSLRETLEGNPSTDPVWRGSPAATVLRRTIFAVVPGTTTESWLKARGRMFHIDAEILEVTDYRSGLEKLLDHRVDVLFGDAAAILGEMSEAAHARLVILDRRFTHEPYALPIPRDDDDFRLLVDGALSAFYASDGFGESYAHWFKRFDDQTRTFFLWNTLPEHAREMTLTSRAPGTETQLARAADRQGTRP